MLKYKHKITINNQRENITLKDCYVSPDLSYISGTTSLQKPLSVGDKLWVSSSYFPRNEGVTISFVDTVKRNGYIITPKQIQIKYEDLHYQGIENNIVHKRLRYIEHEGDVFFQDVYDESGIFFDINGKRYKIPETANTITIDEKIYIENDQITLNGVIYNVLIATDEQGDKNVIYTDNSGKEHRFNTIEGYDTSNVSLLPEYIQKIVINNQSLENYNIKDVTKFGYKSYIIYNNTKIYLQYIGDNDLTFGVIINNKTYLYFESLSNVNPFNIESYKNDPDYGTPILNIEGFVYEIFFEESQAVPGDYICIEMIEEHLPILLEDTITIKSDTQTPRLYIKFDKDSEYVFYKGHKYNRIKNLCDQVIIQNNTYDLTYFGNYEEPKENMLCTCTFPNGDVNYFTVNQIENDTIINLRKGKMVDGKFTTTFSIIKDENGNPKYSDRDLYEVLNCDGIQINGEKYPIHIDEAGKEYIVLSSPMEYCVTVVNTWGSNKFICVPKLTITSYTNEEHQTIIQDELTNILTLDYCEVLKTPNLFGTRAMTPKEWVVDTLMSHGGTSMYQLSGLFDNLSFERNNNFFNIPITLSKNVNHSINQEDLTHSYIEEKLSKNSNLIVDVDKDIYTPFGVNDIIKRITFNLHFRTRDLDTWKLYEDLDALEGFENPVADYFSNWFITDYYPYNQTNKISNDVEKDELINEYMNRSDLLGYLFFTTDDVKSKRKKITGSFLRLTFFDSINPDKQNMLGTTTIFMDADRHHKTIYSELTRGKLIYRETTLSHSGDTTNNQNKRPTVLDEVYTTGGTLCNENDDNGYLPRLDSRIVIDYKNLYKHSIEGYYAYIIKEFGNTERSQTIYMKVEFFHAGLGIKIPMVIATDNKSKAIKKWTSNTLQTFKKGYDLNNVYQRLYIPINIEYHKDSNRYIYSISDENSYSGAIMDNNEWIFNLFELKIKPQ